MSGYIWGLLTLPIAAIVFGLCLVALKATYLGLGLLGRWGVARVGHTDEGRRHRMGAVVATSRRVAYLNRGTTGVVFFTGVPGSGHWTEVNKAENALRRTTRKEG